MSSAAAGVVCYVDNTGSCGDSGPGTATQPFCTITAGAAHALARDTVQVVAGTYAGPVTPPRSGAAGTPVTFAAAPGVTISGGANGFAISGKSHVTVRGFKVTGTTSYGISVSGSSNVTIRDNTVTYSGQPVSGKIAAGIKLSNVTSSTVAGDTADHNSASGIFLASGTSGVTVSGNRASWNAEGYQRNGNGITSSARGTSSFGNILHDNEDSGIQPHPGGNNNLAAANVTYNNGDHGIDTYNVTGGRVIGNTVYRNCTTGINVEGTSGSYYVVQNNIAVTMPCTRPTRASAAPAGPATSASGIPPLRRRPPNTTSSGSPPPGGTTSGPAPPTTASRPCRPPADRRRTAYSPTRGSHRPRAGTSNCSRAQRPPIRPTRPSTGGSRPTCWALCGLTSGHPNTGAGPRSFDDRGAYEFQPSTTTTSTTTSITSTTATTSTTLPGGTTNFVGNGGFETDLSGWAKYPSGGVTLARVSPGHSGNWAVEVRNTSPAAISYCTLNDSPNWIRATQAGTYTVAAWVRANTAGATVKLTLSEYSGSIKVGSSSAAATLSTSWQLIRISYTPVAPGSNLDFNLYTKDAPLGQCLQADDISETLS